MRKLIFMSVCAMTVMVQAEDLIPAGAKNLATSSGPKTTKSANMHTYNSLFNGVRDRWLGYKPNPTTEYYPSETVTFTESRPLVNAYRVWRGQANSSDRDQTRQATKWELYGSNDGGETLTLLHAQTESVIWYVNASNVIDYVDCVFENTVPYSTYRFRVIANGGHGSYVSVDDVGLYCLERTDTLTVEHNGFELGEPTPGYGAISGLKEGDVVKLSMADSRVVDPTASRRYELTGFTVKNPDGDVLYEGTKDELPYEYVHGTRGATVVWNWSDLIGEFSASRRKDQTKPERAQDNTISDGKLDGSAVAYYSNSTRQNYGPQYLFDGNTAADTASRWFLGCATPYYAQYVFRENGAETPRFVTGMSLRGIVKNGRSLYEFDLQGSNDGEDWKTLLSVKSPTAFASGTWDFASTDSFSRYRLVIQKADFNLELYNLELYNYRTDDVLEIIGSPAYGQPAPDYGVVTNLVAGDRLTLTAPSTVIDISAGERSQCTGYQLVVEGQEPVKGQGTTCSYVHSGKGAVLTWLFSSTYRQRVGVKGSGSVDCEDDFFVADGSPLTITATPESDDEPFLEWQGDVPDGQANNPVLTFTVDRPRSLTAVFAAPTYVSVTGDDANDGASWAKAVRTVARGWEVSGGAGKLYLGEGEFEVAPGVLSVTHSFQLIGQGADKSVLLADNSEANGTLLTVDHERAVVTGVRVKGATISSGLGAGLVLKAGTVTNCWIDSCSSSGKAGGAWLNGTGLLVDSVVTNCTAGNDQAGGVYVSSGRFLRNVVTDCSAKTCGAAYFMASTTVADSVFRGNSSWNTGGAIGCTSKTILFTNCVFASNLADSHSGVIDECPTGITFVDCLFTNNVSRSRGGVGAHFGGTIRRSRLVGNQGAGAYGGLLWMEDRSNGSRLGSVLESCLVTANVGGQGVILSSANTTIRNCTIVSNRCSSDGALRAGSEVLNSIVAGNYSGGTKAVVSNWTGSAANAAYCCIPNHDPSVLGTGSISDDPRFTDAANGDYTLRWNSPCVNAGSNGYVTKGAVDLLGNPRIRLFGGRAKHEVVDMGCYESPWRRMPGLQLFVR